MAFSSSDVEALERAIASGATEVRYRDRTVKYSSIDKMFAALERLRREVNAAEPKLSHYAKFKRR